MVTGISSGTNKQKSIKREKAIGHIVIGKFRCGRPHVPIARIKLQSEMND